MAGHLIALSAHLSNSRWRSTYMQIMVGACTINLTELVCYWITIWMKQVTKYQPNYFSTSYNQLVAVYLYSHVIKASIKEATDCMRWPSSYYQFVRYMYALKYHEQWYINKGTIKEIGGLLFCYTFDQCSCVWDYWNVKVLID